jgi:DNA (cytosine-5)-methyltransferase 1
MSSPKLISLFSGAGGLDYGFEAAGFETAVTVEMDRDCCQTLRANRSWPVIEDDIFAVPTSEMLKAGGLRSGDVDLLIGGPPCQPFSKSGYWARGDSARLDDPRAGTLGAYLRVLEESLPRAFLIENVEGLAYDGKDEGLRLLLDAIGRINARTGSNYQVSYRVLTAVNYGVPQIRRRFLLVGSRDGKAFQFPEPTHADPGVEQVEMWLSPCRTAWDALADIEPDPDENLEVRGKWASLLPSIPEGQNYLWHTNRMGGLPLFGWRRRFWSFLLKLAKNQPSWTIQAQPGPAVGPFHWSNRRLSMRELCRLQTFPDDVTIRGGRTSVQRQVGNAVPSLLAEVLGRSIRSQLLGHRAMRGPLRLLPPDRSPAPKPEPVRRVPTKFRQLIGEHEPHPGTGKGHAAIVRSNYGERSSLVPG